MKKKQPATPAAPAKMDEPTRFRESMPDHPWERFLLAFGLTSPPLWLGALGLCHGSHPVRKAFWFALVVGCLLGLISAFGKRPMAWILNINWFS